MTGEPIRLADDVAESKSLRRILDEARNSSPLHYDIEAGLGRHKALVASKAGSPSWSSEPARITRDATFGKLGKLVAVGVAVGAGGVVVALTLVDPRSAPDQDALPASRSAVTDVEPPTPAQARGSIASDRSDSGDADASPAERSDPVPVTPPIQREHRRVSPDGKTPRKATANQPKPPLAADDAVKREIAQMALARALLSQSPARALSQLRATSREFPRGFLTEEREALVALALWELGRTNEAIELGRAFLAKYPGSSFARRVREITKP